VSSSGVSIERVSKRFVGRTEIVEALDEVDVKVRPGEFFVIVGPSGSGKTTLLRIISGLDAPDEGEIRVGGEIVTSVARGVSIAPKDRQMSFVFQNYALYPHMSAARNIEFPLLHLRKDLSPRERAAKVRDVAGSLEIGHLLDRKPKELSEGQRQRVAIARAIMRDPRVFLMDEPLANLDISLRMTIRSQLKALQRRLGITTIYVTHDQHEAMALGDAIAVIHRGRVQQVGTPTEIYESPANRFGAEFVGENPINMLDGELVVSDETTFFQSEGFRLALRKDVASRIRERTFRRCAIGVRPQDVVVKARGQGVMDVSLILVENVGSKYLLHAFSDHSKGMNVETRVLPKGDFESRRFSIDLDDENMLFFDSVGRRIDLSN